MDIDDRLKVKVTRPYRQESNLAFSNWTKCRPLEHSMLSLNAPWPIQGFRRKALVGAFVRWPSKASRHDCSYTVASALAGLAGFEPDDIIVTG